MEENKELIVIKKVPNAIKRFLYTIPLKKIGILVLYFLGVYVLTELLNGDYVAFRKIIGLNVAWEERLKYIKDAVYNFFVFPKSICSIFIFLFIYWIFYGITKKTKLSCLIISTIGTLFGIINYVVTEARGISISISDIFSVQTALNVANGLNINISAEVIVAILIFLVINIWIWKFCKFDETNVEKKRNKLLFAVIGIIGMLCLYNTDSVIDKVELWSVNFAYKTSGSGLTIMKMLKDFKVEVPESYNKEEIEKLLAQYDFGSGEKSGDFPNVLVVMNESFADLPEIFNFKVSGDNLTYFHEFLKEENVVSGKMHSSKLGGGTSNVEYEFLTQNATAFLPAGSVPYQQYISAPVKQSIITYMNNAMYETYGIHCATKSNYSRGKVYNFLQFNNPVFIEDMENVERGFNNYATDRYVYKYWMNIMNTKDKSSKNFTYLLTIQNHSPYNEIDEKLNQYVEGNNELNSYMQNLSIADAALEELITFIKNYEEDTILLFFGDHQPNLKLEKKYGSNGSYDVDVASHIVPFFIWANYDIEEKNQIEISANYLHSLLFEVADMPMDEYTQYVNEVRKIIPVITTKYYIGQDGVKYMLDDKTSPYYDKLQEYWKVIYYQMFDRN